ncbi:MAG: uroporphyrinogen-III C-methyltransferase [Betaproteobacteria bacterium]|nr:uroporphyrinogen-III C-methyltransferase [Betaproteobacteria bacterium]
MHDAANAGMVYLIGAGPGDPDLLTLKAVKALRCAEVVLIDDLAGDAVLEHANPAARVVHVGKRGGCQSTPQAFIERLMVAEARAGRIVARLKGGDPFIFGRGGEECSALRSANIRHEVINGITAGLAAPTALGIPLTHREVCNGAILVTGHSGEALDDAGPDWRALAATRLPLVIYMGIAQCETIERELLAGGLAPDTPVAVIQHASRRNQRELITRLSGLSANIRSDGIGSPGIIVVGETVRFAARFTNPSAIPQISDGYDNNPIKYFQQ